MLRLQPGSSRRPTTLDHNADQEASHRRKQNLPGGFFTQACRINSQLPLLQAVRAILWLATTRLPLLGLPAPQKRDTLHNLIPYILHQEEPDF